MDIHSLPLPWQICAEEAWDAFLHKTVPIGSCLMSKEGELISRGRNHIYDDESTAGVPPAVAFHKLAHAELNCLLNAKGLSSFIPTSIYSTVEPCPLCMGAIYMTGTRTIHYAVPDPYAGSTNLLGTTPYLTAKKFTVKLMDDLQYTNIMAAWNFYFFFFEKVRRGSDWFTQDAVMDMWKEAMPEAHALAVKVWEQYPSYEGPFMQMNVQESINFWEEQAEDLFPTR